ncbi:hypothetical protein RND71_003749 [Anisodus tanguticus]|uniref:Uncharacterized protein n=1 Tax=Anisodus tanguticus TaxID=243964 RepID=A0AAE1VP00_9SOLA|nr:hypothetical protein RND71_003749 [Anisodus tanguticus]
MVINKIMLNKMENFRDYTSASSKLKYLIIESNEGDVAVQIKLLVHTPLTGWYNGTKRDRIRIHGHLFETHFIWKIGLQNAKVLQFDLLKCGLFRRPITVTQILQASFRAWIVA